MSLFLFRFYFYFHFLSSIFLGLVTDRFGMEFRFGITSSGILCVLYLPDFCPMTGYTPLHLE